MLSVKSGRAGKAFSHNRQLLSPELLKKRYNSWKFRGAQRRRSQTEGRIGIFKANFLGSPVRSKGFAHRNLSLAWAVLTHNLWVMARLGKLEANPQAKAA